MLFRSSLFMDISSEMIHSLLPVFMVTVLGTSLWAVGLIEGLAESTALIVKVFSGVLSDLFRRRKPLVVLGYGLAAVTKLVFPLASTVGWIVGARFAGQRETDVSRQVPVADRYRVGVARDVVHDGRRSPRGTSCSRSSTSPTTWKPPERSSSIAWWSRAVRSACLRSSLSNSTSSEMLSRNQGSMWVTSWI